MYKRIVVGLIVAFVVAAAMPLVAQAQSNCKYVGPADPLSLNTVSAFDEANAPGVVKTIKAQKEIFYCYSDAKSVPDDKTLQDPLANRDKIAKNLRWIVELEILAYLVSVPNNQNGTEFRGFKAIRCVKEPVTANNGSTTLHTWVVTSCTTFARSDDPTELVLEGNEFLPPIPATAARGCAPEFVQNGVKKASKQPYLGGPIPIEDPTEMNTVVVDANGDGDADLIKTIKVNKEVFRCFTSGSLDSPAIYDVELYYSEFETLGDGNPFLGGDDDRSFFDVAYCAKKEKEAILLGCSWKRVDEVPFAEAASAGLLAELRPFVTLRSVELKQGGGQFSFEAQGYNIEGVQVQVYNLAGKAVFSAESAGNSLSWNGLSSDGRRLANGVYLYVLTVKGTYGDIVQTKVQKLAILR
jgi:hypothetical protein